MFSQLKGTFLKGGGQAMNIIDVHDLREEDANFVQRMVEFLRKTRKEREGEAEEISFATWPLGVKGNLTRKELYDYL